MNSCNGRTATRGRRAFYFIVESLDGKTRLSLPPLYELDDIPDIRNEITTPEEAKFHPHLGRIVSEIPQIDMEAEILLLIGRDLVEAHHVHEQIIGPRHAPFAEKLSLGWTIIGEACLGGAHRPDASNIVVNKTHVNHRSSILVPCPHTYDVTSSDFKMDRDVFIKTLNDEKSGLSVGDREILFVFRDRHQHGLE